MKTKRYIISMILMLASVMLLAACTNQQPAIQPAPVAPVLPVAPVAPVAPVEPVAPVAPVAPIPPATRTINTDISNFKFNDVTINAGDTVIWTNQDGAAHTVTSDSGSELDSPRLSNGQTYSHTFTDEGVYTYHCSVHLTMKGKVTVS